MWFKESRVQIPTVPITEKVRCYFRGLREPRRFAPIAAASRARFGRDVCFFEERPPWAFLKDSDPCAPVAEGA